MPSKTRPALWSYSKESASVDGSEGSAFALSVVGRSRWESLDRSSAIV